MQQFIYIKNDNLPRLAWCARLRTRSNEVMVEHGPWVESRKGCFYAAVWSGSLDEARPDEAVTCCGTGARLQSDSCIFFTSSNVHDRLYLKRVPNGVVISNSLTYLLVTTDDEPAPNYFMYNELFCVFSGQGIRRKQRSLPSRHGRVEVYECCNLKFSRGLELEWCNKPAPPPPSDYESYISLLETHLESVLDNASDATRIVSYSPVANNTRGYDSNFVAALARKQGVVETITFAENVPGEPSPDDGTPVAEFLGLNVHKFPKRDYTSTERFPEAEFLACPPGWESPMGATENALVGKLNLNGQYGGVILSTDSRKLLPDLADPVIGANGIATWEYRLRVACLEFPLFYTGWQHGKMVFEISTSTAMRPWSIGGDYDKPISRRFLEEAGVPRELFGQIKYAGSVEVLTSKDQFRPATWVDIEAFIIDHSRNHQTHVKAPERYLYHWAFYRTRERYDRALGKK